ncbi:MAG: hypothetical protein FJW37_06155 [Acidobacteria bacterium]|nr:hypothetical protein [Acidobacteriota bacterium]
MKALALSLGLFLVAAAAAPLISAESFRQRMIAALERGLGRRVAIEGEVRFITWGGPGFSATKVVVHEDPAAGLEPFAYAGSLEARLRLSSLWRGRLEFSSLRLEEASLNLAQGPGGWNFVPLVSRDFVSRFPRLALRSSRLNFRFEDQKSRFYLLNAEMDITPGPAGWDVSLAGEPARTDRPARGFGSFSAHGRWTRAGELDLELALERSRIEEAAALLDIPNSGVHGMLSSRLRLRGPLARVRISGSLDAGDIHRWDLLPGGSQEFRLPIQGRLDLARQELELEAHPPGRGGPTFSARLRAHDFLGQPRWGVSVTWIHFPVEPLLAAASHMGAPVPAGLKLAGWLEGAVSYTTEGRFQGEVALREAALQMPGSEPLRFDYAALLFDRTRFRLVRSSVVTSANDRAQLEGDLLWEPGEFHLAIQTDHMDVAALRSQAGLAGVPLLEQVRSGSWSGRLRYDRAGWSGLVRLEQAELAWPGLAEPVAVASAVVRIQGARVFMDRIRARAGSMELEADYLYEPDSARPHRLRLAIPELTSAELERLLAPTLRRSRGLLARALGQSPLPPWLSGLRLAATVQVAALAVDHLLFQNVHCGVVWDGGAVAIESLTARVEPGEIRAALDADLSGPEPVYELQSFALDTPGGPSTGPAALAQLRGETMAER